MKSDQCITVSYVCAPSKHVRRKNFCSWMFSHNGHICSWSNPGSGYFQCASGQWSFVSFAFHTGCTWSLASHPEARTSPYARQISFFHQAVLEVKILHGEKLSSDMLSKIWYYLQFPILMNRNRDPKSQRGSWPVFGVNTDNNIGTTRV